MSKGFKASPELTVFNRKQKIAIEKMNLAKTYFDDGALATAAKLLRESANLLDEANAIKSKVLAAV